MSCAREATILLYMTTDREEIRAWLGATLTHMGWSGSDLAKRISVVPSTINRFLNDPDAKHSLSAKTLKAIEKATGFAPLVFPTGARTRASTDGEAAFLSDNDTSGDAAIDEAMRNMRRLQGNIRFWKLRSRALEAAGFLPGDVLAVDISEVPRAGDVVCADVDMIYPGRTEAVFRVFDPPYLVAATGAMQLLKPLIVDERHVIIKGVVVNMFRATGRKSAA